MATVNIGISHNDNLVIAQTVNIKRLADPDAKRLNHSDNLLVGKHLIETCSLGIQYLASQRKDCLRTVVTAFFCRSRRRVTLDDIYFTFSWALA